ncbi:MAG: LuxR family transcriptional regulator [Paenibacillaceae bacterium]|jgi:NarL family two-component system response regulator LiaR|nr:LuxR family transcriptional regulator [Paenibacillaceae bacterium]
MNNSIKVAIVDDHDMVRLGLKTYLLMEPRIEVIGEAGSGKEALWLLEQISGGDASGLPDVILMDLMMPGMDGIETTIEVLKRYPSVKVVMLTSFLEEDKVVKAIEAGATSYVLKTIQAEQLITVIDGASRGMPVLVSEVSQALTRGIRQKTAHNDGEGFTVREKEVLLLIADGKSNKEISDELHISIKTVKTHVSNLLMKCALDDRTQLAIYAHRKGWVVEKGI